MTDAEFATWAKQLFISFPSLWEWLQTSSPEPKETQKVWRKTLADYSLAECQAVLEAWATGAQQTFAQYERDRVHHVVRACCEYKRGQLRRKRENQRVIDQAKRYAGAARSGVSAVLSVSDLGIREAADTVAPEAKEVWARYRAFEISFDEFQAQLEPLKRRAVAALEAKA